MVARVNINLAKRILALPVWEELRGFPVAPAQQHRDKSGVLWRCSTKWHGWLPDVDDPATRGVLLDKVREVWGDQDMYVCRIAVGGPPRVAWSALGSGTHGATEAAALVAALEQAFKESK